MRLLLKSRQFYARHVRRHRALITVPLAGPALLIIDPHFAGSLCRNVTDALSKASLNSPIAKALSLVALVWGGLAASTAEGRSKYILASIIFGLGIAIAAINIFLMHVIF